MTFRTTKDVLRFTSFSLHLSLFFYTHPRTFPLSLSHSFSLSLSLSLSSWSSRSVLSDTHSFSHNERFAQARIRTCSLSLFRSSSLPFVPSRFVFLVRSSFPRIQPPSRYEKRNARENRGRNEVREDHATRKLLSSGKPNELNRTLFFLCNVHTRAILPRWFLSRAPSSLYGAVI